MTVSSTANGTERKAPATPHIMYQKTSAKSTTTGWSCDGDGAEGGDSK